jgi:hypothetical protein
MGECIGIYRAKAAITKHKYAAYDKKKVTKYVSRILGIRDKLKHGPGEEPMDGG